MPSEDWERRPCTPLRVQHMRPRCQLRSLPGHPKPLSPRLPPDNPVGPTLGELVLDLAVDVAEELDVSHGCLRAVLRQVRQEPRLGRVLVGHATQSLHQVRPLGADHAEQAVQRGARRRLELGHAEARRVDARGRRDPEQRLQQLGGRARADPEREREGVVEEVAVRAVQLLERERRRVAQPPAARGSGEGERRRVCGGVGVGRRRRGGGEVSHREARADGGSCGVEVWREPAEAQREGLRLRGPALVAERALLHRVVGGEEGAWGEDGHAAGRAACVCRVLRRRRGQGEGRVARLQPAHPALQSGEWRRRPRRPWRRRRRETAAGGTRIGSLLARGGQLAESGEARVRAESGC
mmetsp:Transcript_26581/g.79301  ORF Transcript_26581/g.79301 Transcript_26581/m.79301 type:complete len:354 (+) Transcript_26581:184-1245(+)